MNKHIVVASLVLSLSSVVSVSVPVMAVAATEQASADEGGGRHEQAKVNEGGYITNDVVTKVGFRDDAGHEYGPNDTLPTSSPKTRTSGKIFIDFDIPAGVEKDNTLVFSLEGDSFNLGAGRSEFSKAQGSLTVDGKKIGTWEAHSKFVTVTFNNVAATDYPLGGHGHLELDALLPISDNKDKVEDTPVYVKDVSDALAKVGKVHLHQVDSIYLRKANTVATHDITTFFVNRSAHYIKSYDPRDVALNTIHSSAQFRYGEFRFDDDLKVYKLQEVVNLKADNDRDTTYTITFPEDIDLTHASVSLGQNNLPDFIKNLTQDEAQELLDSISDSHDVRELAMNIGKSIQGGYLDKQQAGDDKFYYGTNSSVGVHSSKGDDEVKALVKTIKDSLKVEGNTVSVTIPKSSGYSFDDNLRIDNIVVPATADRDSIDVQVKYNTNNGREQSNTDTKNLRQSSGSADLTKINRKITMDAAYVTGTPVEDFDKKDSTRARVDGPEEFYWVKVTNNGNVPVINPLISVDGKVAEIVGAEITDPKRAKKLTAKEAIDYKLAPGEELVYKVKFVNPERVTNTVVKTRHISAAFTGTNTVDTTVTVEVGNTTEVRKPVAFDMHTDESYMIVADQAAESLGVFHSFEGVDPNTLTLGNGTPPWVHLLKDGGKVIGLDVYPPKDGSAKGKHHFEVTAKTTNRESVKIPMDITVTDNDVSNDVVTLVKPSSTEAACFAGGAACDDKALKALVQRNKIDAMVSRHFAHTDVFEDYLPDWIPAGVWGDERFGFGLSDHKLSSRTPGDFKDEALAALKPTGATTTDGRLKYYHDYTNYDRDVVAVNVQDADNIHAGDTYYGQRVIPVVKGVYLDRSFEVYIEGRQAASITPAWADTDVMPGTKMSIPQSGQKIPAKTVFHKVGGPDWVKINESTGEITGTVPSTTQPGKVKVDVLTRYPDGSEDKNTVTVTIKKIPINTAATALPNTGGNGVYWWLGGGLLAAIVGAGAVMFSRRKEA